MGQGVRLRTETEKDEADLGATNGKKADGTGTVFTRGRIVAYFVKRARLMKMKTKEGVRKDIGFLAWARYTLIDLISICKRSQLREANIRAYHQLKA